MKFGMEIPNENLTRKRKIRENRSSDSHTLRKGVNEFILVVPVFLDRSE